MYLSNLLSTFAMISLKRFVLGVFLNIFMYVCHTIKYMYIAHLMCIMHV